jgi:hypothetical protein
VGAARQTDLVALITEQPPDAGIDAGVIEEARERQRRRWMRVAAAIAALAGLVIGLVIALGGGGGSGRAGGLGESSLSRPSSLTFRNGVPYIDGRRFVIAETPTLTGGDVGLDVRALMSGLSAGGYPTPANPVIASFDDGLYMHTTLVAGGIYASLVGPEVASMRVTHLGTFKPHPDDLPLGEKVFIFTRPLGSRGDVIGPNTGDGGKPGKMVETFYSSTGKQITTAETIPFRVPSSYWHAPATPSRSGRCLVRSTLTDVTAHWGQVATAIEPDPTVHGPAFLSCSSTWYTWHHVPFAVGILLNAESPGNTPAALWGATPLTGHPGIVQINPVEKTSTVLAPAPSFVARRIGPAWIVVTGGNSLAQRAQFLNGLHITKLDLTRSS